MIEGLSTDTLLRLVEIGSIILGGGAVAGSIRTSMKLQSKRLEALEDDVRALNKVITAVAVQDTRIKNVEDDLRELKHGEGFIFPLTAHLKGK